MSDITTVSTDKRGVSRLVINRPEKHNAFDDELIKALLSKLNTLVTTNKTRVLVLASEGRSFCAGADLNWMKKTAQYSVEENQADALQLATLLSRLNEFPAPVIARVQGTAFGGGVGLVACCDIAICAATAKFSLSEVKLGLIPAAISPFVIDTIGARMARRYFLTAEVFDADIAQSLQLVHQVVAPEDLDSTVDKLIEQILIGGPQAQQAAKVLVSDLQFAKRDQSLMQHTASQIAKIRASDEGREGVTAFLEKRKPHWHPES